MDTPLRSATMLASARGSAEKKTISDGSALQASYGGAGKRRPSARGAPSGARVAERSPACQAIFVETALGSCRTLVPSLRAGVRRFGGRQSRPAMAEG